MKFGYARISTPQQSLEHQITNLERADCKKVFQDTCSGAHSRRPGFDALSLCLREGDIVTVTTLDRLGRTNRTLLQLIEEWNKKNIHLHILSHDIDTTTTNGKFVFSIMAALAEQERNLIKERIKKGLEGARARGLTGGRPLKLDKKTVERMKALYDAQSLTVKEIALMYGITPCTVYNYLKKGMK